MGLKCLLVAGSLAMSMSMAVDAASGGLSCAMSMPAVLTAGAPAELRWSLRNTGAKPVSVLSWNTPLEGGIFAEFLSLERDGKALPFSGALMKRGDPEAGEYLRLAPGQAEEAVIDLGLAWPVDAPGHYRLRYTGRLLDVAEAGAALPRPRDAWRGQALDCPELSFERRP
ncbi:MAG: protease [Gammaproteobacteria bacterium]|nr:protease [Gammaproteobacteria bacterium]